MRCRDLSLVSTLFLVLVDYVGASCYYPDGSFPTNYAYVPCSGDQFHSCCIMSEGDQCLSNGLCYYPGGQYLFRGACSDKNWNSPNCFNHCTNKTNSYSDSYERITKCSDDRYCCASDGSGCCNDDSKVFTLGNVSVIKDLATTTRKNGGFQALIASPTSAANTVSTASTNTRATPTGTQGDAGNPTASPPTGASNPTSTSTSTGSADTPPAPHSTFSKTTVIAASAASTCVIIAIVGALFFFVRRHYKRKQAPPSSKEHENSYPMSPGEGFQRLPDKSPAATNLPHYQHPPPPVYQSPNPGAYQQPTVHGAVEMDGYAVPVRNAHGQPVFEAPAVPYRGN